MSQIDSLFKNKITVGTVGTFGLNMANQVILFGMIVILARVMTPEQFGLYSVILSLMVLLALPFTGGFSTFIIRHISKYRAQKDDAYVKGVINFSFVWVAIGAILMINLLYHLAPYIWEEDHDIYRLGSGILFASAILLMFGAVNRGFKRVILGRFFEFFLQPVFLISFFVAVYIVGATIDAEKAIYLHMGSIVLSVLLSLPLFFVLMGRLDKSVKAKYDVKSWIKSAIPFILAVGLVIANMNIDIVMVGILAGDEEAGHYRVASRMAAFVPFLLMALNNALAPRISELYTSGKTKELQKILSVSSRLIFICTVPIALLIAIFAEQILGFFFGDTYQVAKQALIILVFANLFSVMMGQVGQVMALTGHELLTAISVFIAVVVNVALNYFFVPAIGIEGAAVATACSIVIWNLLLSYLTEKKTGLRCTALSPMAK